jgi:hypothetical protein
MTQALAIFTTYQTRFMTDKVQYSIEDVRKLFVSHLRTFYQRFLLHYTRLDLKVTVFDLTLQLLCPPPS